MHDDGKHGDGKDDGVRGKHPGPARRKVRYYVGHARWRRNDIRFLPVPPAKPLTFRVKAAKADESTRESTVVAENKPLLRIHRGL